MAKNLALTSIALSLLAIPAIPKSALILFCSTELLSINRANKEELDHLRLSENTAVVVLLAGFTTSNIFGEIPSKNTLSRTVIGIETANIVNAPLLLSGGLTKSGFPSEALVAARYLKLPKVVLLEEKSLNTYQSAKNIAKIITTQNWLNIILVTDELHLTRAISTFKSQGINVVAHASTGSNTKIVFQDLIPKFSGFNIWKHLLDEIFATLYYMLTGKISMETIL